MLIHDYLTRSARRFPGKTALVCGTEQTSYAALDGASSALAAHLLGNGLERGDRVLICLENSREAVAAIFGTLSAGGCIVVVNPTTPGERLSYLLEHSGARFVVCATSRVSAFESMVTGWSWAARMKSRRPWKARWNTGHARRRIRCRRLVWPQEGL